MKFGIAQLLGSMFFLNMNVTGYFTVEALLIFVVWLFVMIVKRLNLQTMCFYD